MVYLRGCHVIVSPSLFSILELLFQVPNCFCHSFLLTSQSNYLYFISLCGIFSWASVFLAVLFRLLFFYLSGNKGAFFVLQLDLLQEQSYLDVSWFMAQLGYFAFSQVPSHRRASWPSNILFASRINFTSYQAGLYILRAELLIRVHKDQGSSLWPCFPPATTGIFSCCVFVPC